MAIPPLAEPSGILATIIMKMIKGNLELKKDTVFKESITVIGNITGRFDLKVAGDIDARNIDAWNIDARNIDAWNIDAWNIDARNIDAWNINAWNIDALDIDAWNINAWNIICVSRRKKGKAVKTIAYSIVTDRFKRERKEVMPELKNPPKEGDGDV